MIHIAKDIDSHVEHGYSRESSRVPLFLVSFNGGVQTIGEFSNNGDRPFCSWQVLLLCSVDSLFENEEGDDDGEGCRSDSFTE